MQIRCATIESGLHKTRQFGLATLDAPVTLSVAVSLGILGRL
ncbi:MAG: hypothetical protein ABI451_01660 [Dokdonella sp.]